MAEQMNLDQLADSIFASFKSFALAAISKRVGPLEGQIRSLTDKVDALSRENAVLAHRLAELEQKDATRPELRAVR
jgi:hypothetical protein